MKTKGLAIILVIAILASCLVISTHAAVDSAVHSVYLTNCNYTIVGWSGMGAPSDTLKVDDSDGTYMIKKLPAGDYVNPGKVVIAYAHGTKDGEGIDLTGCDYLVLHAYISSTAIADLKWQVELNSNTRTSDQDGEQERVYTFTQLAGELKAGWNDLKVPLNVLTPAQLANFQWLRFYTSPSAGSLAEDVIVAIDSLYGQKGEDKVVVSDCKLEMKGWGSKAKAGVSSDRSYAYQTVTGEVGLAGMNLYFNRNNAYTNDADKYINASGMKFLVFDLYVSDASKVKDTQFCLEIASAGQADKEEWGIVKTLNHIADYKLHDGWNEIILGLDREDVGYTEGNTKWDHVNWFRFFNNATVQAGEGFTWGLDNIYFWDGISDLADGYDYEYYTKVGIGDDFVEKCTTGKHGEGNFYFADAQGELILNFPVKNAATANKAFIITKTGCELLLQVSTDGTNWVDLFRDESGVSGGIQVGSRYFDITDKIDLKAAKNIYVRYADSVPSNGNGGRCYDISLFLSHEIQEIVDPHNTIITTFDSNAGCNWPVNNTIKNQGKASVAKTFSGTAGANGGILFQLQFSGLKTKSFDTRNFEAVVFDMYVSDTSVIKDIKFQMEFTSGGGCDVEESNINDTFAKYVAEGTTFKAGWNTIVIPFSKMAGALNREKLNYMRFYNLDKAEFANATTIAFDNLRLWDGQGSVYGAGKVLSTKVQGFSVYTGATKDAKYDSLHPDDANANVHTDAFSKQELQYLVFTNAPSNGNDGNRGRYHDGQTYSIWKFDTKDALTAKFIATCHNSILLQVSTDMQNWTEVFSSGTERSAQETRIFDLTEYIDGDTLYVKASDSKPDDGWGFYVMPTGTYFVTEIMKDNDPSDTSDVNISFTEWADDSYDYVLSDWWAGKTGERPFYDRGIGDTKKFGGPQIVFAFPTNPNNEYAAVNLQVSSNAMIEVSTDFINWNVFTAKTNYDAGQRASKWLDISKYVGGTDMVYIRVRSPMDMDGNGPQIWTDAPIQFISRYDVPEEIIWDDCSTADNVVSLFTYNEEFNGIGFVREPGMANRVAIYGKADANPIDVRLMNWFEFDVYVSDPFPKGYNNQYVLELLDAPNSSDKHEIQYSDFVINQGWNHVVLPLPGNYVRNASGTTGAIDLSKLTSFRFFSVTEEDAANYTLVIKNVKFSRTLYVPNADWNHMTPNDTQTWVKSSEGFTYDIGDANVVELDIYSAKPEVMGLDQGYGMRLEITSAGKCDNEEQEINLKTEWEFKEGWNHIIIPLKDNTVDANSFDRTHVNYVRIHGKVGSGNLWSVRNIKFTHNDLLDADINMYAKKGDRPVVAKTDFELDLSDAGFVAFDLYLQDPELFMTMGGFMALELSSSGKCDVQEYQFTFGDPSTHTYPNSIDVSGLKAGWNRIILPLRDALVTAGPVNDAAINYLRIHLHCNTEKSTAGAGWVAVRDFEGVGTLPVVELINDQGDISFVLGDVEEGTIISAEELVPGLTFEALEEGDVYDAIVDALYEANADVFENYEVGYSASAILLDDAEGIFVVDDVMLVKLGTLELDGDKTYALYTIEDGDLVKVETEILEEGGLTFEADEFKAYFIVAAMLQSKAGTTALTDVEVTNTDEVFEEGTVVHVDVIKQSDADQELLDTIQESLEDFQEEYEATLTPKEMTSNEYTYSTVAIYDVYALKDMAEVQPSGAVKMSIPAPALTAFETAKLFHVHDDGTKEEVEYTVNGNRWEFELDGFSNLVIVKVTAEPVTNPYTGDTLVVYIGLAVISMIALAGCAVLFVKKRKNNA